MAKNPASKIKPFPFKVGDQVDTRLATAFAMRLDALRAHMQYGGDFKKESTK